MACVPGNTKPIGSQSGVTACRWARPCLTFFAKRNPMTCRSLGTLGKSFKITFPIDCNIQMKYITLQNTFRSCYCQLKYHIIYNS